MSKAKVPAGKFLSFDSVHFWVGNAKQAVSFYITRFGFKYLAYKGLETGSKDIVTHVIKQGNIVFAFSSALQPNNKEMGEHLMKHGDGAREVSFTVDDATSIYEAAIQNGAISIAKPYTIEDENGKVILSSIKTYGDTVHTFVQRKGYKGVFLPGFKDMSNVVDPLNDKLSPTKLEHLDHVVGNQGWNEMDDIVEWYKDKLGFIRFWSVDDKQIHTDFSALKSTVVCDVDENCKMPINEPAKGKKTSQIEEYVNFYGGPGVQHIALRTENILESVVALKERGVEFLSIPETYYEHLEKRLINSSVKVKEDLATIKKLHILVDFDDKGYLLQIFTKPVEDRPTVFFEVIQRNNNSGFGIGNFKALFQSIEEEQKKRGTLTEQETTYKTAY